MKIWKDNLITAGSHVKQEANKGRSKRSFEIGEMMFVQFQPYKQTTLKVKGKHKL